MRFQFIYHFWVKCNVAFPPGFIWKQASTFMWTLISKSSAKRKSALDFHADAGFLCEKVLETEVQYSVDNDFKHFLIRKPAWTFCCTPVPKPFLIWKPAFKIYWTTVPTHGRPNSGFGSTVHHRLETRFQLKIERYIPVLTTFDYFSQCSEKYLLLINQIIYAAPTVSNPQIAERHIFLA